MRAAAPVTAMLGGPNGPVPGANMTAGMHMTAGANATAANTTNGANTTISANLNFANMTDSVGTAGR